MTKIQWADLSGEEAETAISALLVRILPQTSRMDGSGGDDGVDVVQRTGASEHVFQIKRYHSRLTKSQKRSIEASLDTALKHRPAMSEWTLVLPLDHTPAELRWFTEQLGALVQIPINWFGLTRLEGEFAARPDISRAFLPGGMERRVIDLLAGHNAENAALGAGIPDALKRGSSLQRLTQELDPDYEFDLSFGRDHVGVAVRPKDADALQRNPITVRMKLHAETGSKAAGDIEAHYTFGTALNLGPENVKDLKVTLPGRLSDLLADGADVSISLVPNPPPATRVVVIAIARTRPVAKLPMSVTDVTSGPLGGSRWIVEDDAGVLSLQVEGRPQGAGELSFSFKISDDTQPGDALPAARLISALARSDALRIEVPGNKPVALTLRTETLSVELEEFHQFLLGLELLERIHDSTGVVTGIPTLDTDSMDLLRAADVIWSGQSISWPWGTRSLPAPATWIKERLEESSSLLPRVSFRGSGAETVQVGALEIPLPGPLQIEAEGLIVLNVASLRRTLRCQMHHDGLVQLILASDDRSSVRLLCAKPA